MSITLDTQIKEITRLNKEHEAGLLKLKTCLPTGKIKTVKDLLYYFPTRYADSREAMPTNNLSVGQAVTIYGMMEKVKVRRSFKGHIPMTEAQVIDNTGSIRCIWFNQAYIGKMYPDSTRVKISGTVQSDSRGFFLSNPMIEKTGLETPENQSSLFASGVKEEFLIPVYKETKGVTSLFLYTLLRKIIGSGVLNEIKDTIPKEILKRLSLPELKDALMYIHFPKKESLTIASRKRFSFEEIFYLQLKNYREKVEAKNLLAHKVETDKELLKEFISSFSFKPTKSQIEAINTILKNINKSDPSGMLLEGDVGSGKTFVASCAIYMIVENVSEKNGKTLQVAYMAPTSILAKQHFESFIKYFKHTGIEIGLLTSGVCKKFPSKGNSEEATTVSKNQLLKWIKEGKLNVVVGTHSLIQKSVAFENLALTIIDEQHRFGVKQRKALVRESNDNAYIPHLLSMTATPIPRTLALSIFGDLDLVVIDEMPSERKKIITEIVLPTKRNEKYEFIREELKKGRQVYVICPRIDLPDQQAGEQDEEEKQKRVLKSVKEESKRLGEEIFPEFVVDILHSKMKENEKEEVMNEFLEKKIDILVATSVVEVGINVPNATVIVIEGAERFGLSQLHQLRGRVGRASHQSYCFLFSDSNGDVSQKRLSQLANAKNGFELAEMDMNNRGIGTLFDGKQWGVSDIAMEAIKNPKLVEIARKEAKDLIDSDKELKKHQDIKNKLESLDFVHME